jgi:hypothetical protein
MRKSGHENRSQGATGRWWRLALSKRIEEGRRAQEWLSQEVSTRELKEPILNAATSRR